MRGMKMNAIAAALVAAACAGLSAQTAPTIRIHAARIVDGAGKVLTDSTIVVQGSKITSIERGGAATATYDLGALTVMDPTAVIKAAAPRRRRKPCMAPKTLT